MASAPDDETPEGVAVECSIVVNPETGGPAMLLQFEHGYLMLQSPDAAEGMVRMLVEMNTYFRQAITQHRGNMN